MQRMFPWNTQLQMGCLHKICPLIAQGSSGKKRHKCQRGQRTPEQGPLNQVSKTHMNSLKQQEQCLHGSALGLRHIYYSFWLSVFKGLLGVWVSDFCDFSWGSFPSVGLSCPVSLWCFVISYILFCQVWVLSLEECSFLMRNRNGVDLDGGKVGRNWEEKR